MSIRGDADSWAAEDVVGADPPPDDVRVRSAPLAVLERGAAISRPGDLPDAWIALDAFDSKRRPERRSAGRR